MRKDDPFAYLAAKDGKPLHHSAVVPPGIPETKRREIEPRAPVAAGKSQPLRAVNWYPFKHPKGWEGLAVQFAPAEATDRSVLTFRVFSLHRDEHGRISFSKFTRFHQYLGRHMGAAPSHPDEILGEIFLCHVVADDQRVEVVDGFEVVSSGPEKTWIEKKHGIVARLRAVR